MTAEPDNDEKRRRRRRYVLGAATGIAVYAMLTVLVLILRGA